MMTHDLCQRTDYHEIFHTFSVTCLNFELPNTKRKFPTNTHKHISTSNFLFKKSSWQGVIKLLKQTANQIMSWWQVSHKLKFQMKQILISRLVSSARGLV